MGLLKNALRVKRILIALMLLSSSTLYAGGFDISLSNDVASLVYLNQAADLGENGADIGYGVIFNESNDFILNANFLVVGAPANAANPWQFGIGFKVYLGEYDAGNLDVGSMAIGGQIRYVIPSKIPMAATLGSHYAPRITSFGDTQNLVEINLRYEFEIVQSARTFIGYRLLEADFDVPDNAEFDDQAHVGIRLAFD